MTTPSDVPFLLRGGMLPGVTAGLVTGTLAFVMTGDLARGLAFLAGAGFAFALGPRITNAFRAFWRKPEREQEIVGAVRWHRLYGKFRAEARQTEESER